MDENDFHYYHDQDDENPDVNEYEDNQMLNHITHDTLHVSCYLSDDAFTGETWTYVTNYWFNLSVTRLTLHFVFLFTSFHGHVTLHLAVLLGSWYLLIPNGFFNHVLRDSSLHYLAPSISSLVDWLIGWLVGWLTCPLFPLSLIHSVPTQIFYSPSLSRLLPTHTQLGFPCVRPCFFITAPAQLSNSSNPNPSICSFSSFLSSFPDRPPVKMDMGTKRLSH